MEIIIHRINKINELKTIPHKYGCEIDIRTDGCNLILNHDPLKGGDLFTDYLDEYKHGTLVLNIKEAGIEDIVLNEVRKREIKSYFLLDVEFPYIYRATRNGERSIAVRYSEDEPIQLVEKYKEMVDWVWIDTNTILPINNDNVDILQSLNTCLVCPERWGRPEDIFNYQHKLKNLNFELNAVMTALKYAAKWE